MIEISETLTNTAELDAIIQEARQSPFLGDLSHGDLQRLIHNNTIRFSYVDGALAGFGAWIRVNAEWDEIGPFYFSKAYRGRGLGKQNVADVIDVRRAAGRSLYAITRNPAMRGILEGMGFAVVSLRTLPMALAIHAMLKLRPRKLIGFAHKPNPGPMAHLISPYYDCMTK